MTQAMTIKKTMMCLFLRLLVTALLPLVATSLKQQQDDVSFRFRVYWDAESSWESRFLWCVECESSSADGCENGSALVMRKCGSSPQQRFVVDDNHRIMPQSSPELCVTRSKHVDNRIRLTPCRNNNSRQQWYGLDDRNAFELYQSTTKKNEIDYCFAREAAHPGKGDEVFAVDCQESRQEGTSRWDLSNVEGDFNGSDDYYEEECDSCFEVYEGSNTMMQDNKLLGTMEPISTKKDVVDFYCYFCDGDPSFNSEDVISLVPDHSLIFVHRQEATCDLSLVIIHDSKKDYSPGTATMNITGNLERSIVQDGRNSPSDTFTYDADKDETTCSWQWSWQKGKKYRTDGLAHSWHPESKDCIYVDSDFVAGIKKWQFIPGPLPASGSTDPNDYVTIHKKKRLWLCKCGAADVERM